MVVDERDGQLAAPPRVRPRRTRRPSPRGRAAAGSCSGSRPSRCPGSAGRPPAACPGIRPRSRLVRSLVPNMISATSGLSFLSQFVHVLIGPADRLAAVVAELRPFPVPPALRPQALLDESIRSLHLGRAFLRSCRQGGPEGEADGDRVAELRERPLPAAEAGVNPRHRLPPARPRPAAGPALLSPGSVRAERRQTPISRTRPGLGMSHPLTLICDGSLPGIPTRMISADLRPGQVPRPPGNSEAPVRRFY